MRERLHVGNPRAFGRVGTAELRAGREEVLAAFCAARRSGALARPGLIDGVAVWPSLSDLAVARMTAGGESRRENNSDAEVGVGPGSLQAARMFSAAGWVVPSWVGLLAPLEDFVETWDRPEAMPRRRAEEIYAREGWRCVAPACTSRCQLEDHHLDYLSRGGERKATSNRLCLCRFHHRQGEHGTLARCRGQAPLGVLWRLGRADLGVWFRNERRLDKHSLSGEMQA